MGKVSNMTPTSVPQIVKDAKPWGRVLPIGPPRDFSGDEVGTVEAVYTQETVDGRQVPCFRDYWRPTPEQLEILNSGGFLELAQYTSQMVMHGIQVWEDNNG